MGSNVVFARIHCTEKCLTSFLNNVISESKQRFLRVCSSFCYTPFPAYIFSWSYDARKSSLSSLLWVQTLSQILSYEDRAWIIEINCTDDNFFLCDRVCSQSKKLKTLADKQLKKPIPQCQACYKDSWILRVYRFNTEYLQNHSTYCCETYIEYC